MGEISRDELQRLYESLDKGFAGVHARLDTMNGRVAANTTEIAVLKDRGDRTNDPMARLAGGVAIGGGLLMELAHRLWGAK